MDNVQIVAGLPRDVEAIGEVVAEYPGECGLALPIVRALPAGCIAFEVRDVFFEPIAREGDYVAIDVTDRLPVEGAFYLRRYCTEQNAEWRTHEQRNRDMGIVQARPWRSDGWFLGTRPRPGLAMYADGPFVGAHFSDRVVGRVVAILAEDAPLPFATDPLRTATGEELWFAL